MLNGLIEIASKVHTNQLSATSFQLSATSHQLSGSLAIR
jgi:hypothetical protein